MKKAAKPLSDLPEGGGDQRGVALVAYAQQRKQDSRERLLAAAIRKFSDLGYVGVSVEDIAAEAGVNRVTFYRHFSSKSAILTELQDRAVSEGRPQFLKILAGDFRDRATVRRWLADLFARHQSNDRFLAVFSQAAAVDPAVAAHSHRRLAESIAIFGAKIPAFAADPADPAQRHRWLEAWLVLFEILDQSGHALANSGVARDPAMIDVLTDRFLRFVSSVPDRPDGQSISPS